MPSLQDVITFIGNYKNQLALGITWAGIAYVAVRNRRSWRRKQFLAQVNFSLNYVRNGTLMLRTLIEESAINVWLNDHGVKLVGKAAARTTLDQPFVMLDDSDDMDYVKRAVLNVLSERYSVAYVATAIGVPVLTGTFLFGITCEKYGRIRTQKLRIIIIREQDLNSIFASPDKPPPHVLNASHADRITTLRIMHGLRHHADGRMRSLLGEVELGVAAGVSIATATK